jgi:2-polyprenyl-6-methoxyphenol hydroxylase-like FAD-dependent oxidoreductase
MSVGPDGAGDPSAAGTTNNNDLHESTEDADALGHGCRAGASDAQRVSKWRPSEHGQCLHEGTTETRTLQMLNADVGIVGGGLAGSVAAAMLGRAGISCVLIDPHESYPSDFRCEKLDRPQLKLLHKTGLASAILPSTTQTPHMWVARFGRLLADRANCQVGIAYEDLVNAARAAIPDKTLRVTAEVEALSTSATVQRIVTSDHRTFSVRLVVLAVGLNNRLRQSLGISREELSKCHSISIGFDAAPGDHPYFQFPALTYFPEQSSSRVCYVTFFPIKSTMRVNLFVYREMRDPWLREFRNAPEATLLSSLPGLRKFVGPFQVVSEIHLRPVDLYITHSYQQAGVVLVGDAFSTSCPAAGTGTGKVFTDVERLCNVHIPRWLASEGMDASKIGSFYEDPEKIASDAGSASRAFYVRSLALDERLPWRARRVAWCLTDLASRVWRPSPQYLDVEPEPSYRLGPAK